MSEMTREDVIAALRHPLNNTCEEAQRRNEQVIAHDAFQRMRIAELEAQLKSRRNDEN